MRTEERTEEVEEEYVPENEGTLVERAGIYPHHGDDPAPLTENNRNKEQGTHLKGLHEY